MKRIAGAGLGVVLAGVAAGSGPGSTRPAAFVRQGQDAHFVFLRMDAKS